MPTYHFWGYTFFNLIKNLSFKFFQDTTKAVFNICSRCFPPMLWPPILAQATILLHCSYHDGHHFKIRWYNDTYVDAMISMVIWWYLSWHNETYGDTYYTYGDTIITIVIQWSYKDGDTYDQTMMVIPLKPEQ